ncbi:MAG TPA: acyltransferase [Deltaproteobacteria bacterium]|nr:acyltransferase [Deltaproteobacteria bacterium]
MIHVGILKGIAILLIVAFHICGQIYHSEPKWFRLLSYQGVPVFFLLSGIGLTYSVLSKNFGDKKINHWGKWYLKRSIRILPLYWLILFITFSLYFIDLNIIRIAVSQQSEKALLDFVVHFFLINIYFEETYFSINVAWWFLATIVHFYLLFPFIFSVYKHKINRIPSVVLVIVFYYLNKNYHFINNQIALSFMYFFLGIILSFINTTKFYNYIKKYSLVLVLSLFFLSIFFLCSLRGNISNYFPKYTYELFSLSFTSFLYVSSHLLVYIQPLRKVNYFLESIGSYSYALFLVHWGFIYPIINYFDTTQVGIMVYLVFVLSLSKLLTIIDKKTTSLLMIKTKLSV